LIRGVFRLEIQREGYATAKETDDAGNTWSLEVAGEPESVQQFATQNNNAPVQYNLAYYGGEEDSAPLPESRGLEPPSGDIQDEDMPLDVSIVLDLSADMANDSNLIDIELTIDPPIKFNKRHRYRIIVNRPEGASWNNFAVQYKAKGGIDVGPVNSPLAETVSIAGLVGTLTASAQAQAYTFVVVGTHPADSLFPRGQISLAQI
jgi:hypothetical protein